MIGMSHDQDKSVTRTKQLIERLSAGTFGATYTAYQAARRAVVRRADAWLYGLDERFPEYDAYRRRPRRRTRPTGTMAVVAVGVITATVALASGVGHGSVRKTVDRGRPDAGGGRS